MARIKRRSRESNEQRPHRREEKQPMEELDETALAAFEMALLDDDFDIRSFSGNASNEDNEAGTSRRRGYKKKHYHRHTQEQTTKMEAFFSRCPHPDDRQRRELASALGLESIQIKFWFQNKRTQLKALHERQDNVRLRKENERLLLEVSRLTEALSKNMCTSCGGSGPTVGANGIPEDKAYLMENLKLRQEIESISTIAAKYVPFPIALDQPSLDAGAVSRTGAVAAPAFFGHLVGAGEHLPHGNWNPRLDKQMIIEIAVAAMDEVTILAQIGEPVWMPQVNQSLENLNEELYLNYFLRAFAARTPGYKSEATRESVVVPMTAMQLLEIIMDVDRWVAFFSGIVSKAQTLEVISLGIGSSHNGILKVMTAEFQLPTPLVPSRKALFARYCKQHTENSWGVVDVSLESMRINPIYLCRRQPSGLYIVESPEGFSKVTWVEHMEINDSNVGDIYRPLVSSGLAFGAQRWAYTLERQCQRLAIVSNELAAAQITASNQQTAMLMKNWLRLAERMVQMFSTGASAAASDDQWTHMAGDGVNSVRIMTRDCVTDGEAPSGMILNAAASIWLPVSPTRVFSFLRDEASRSVWDILSKDAVLEQVTQLAADGIHGNRVSLLNMRNEVAQKNTMILQESSSDPSGAYVIYAPLDNTAMDLIMNLGDPELVALLPSGFVILPDGPVGMQAGELSGTGTLLTVSYQILVNLGPTGAFPMTMPATFNNLVVNTIEKIKPAVCSETT